MQKKEWNAERFSQSLERMADQAELYAREHVVRLARGQGNGNPRQRDRSYGEAALYELLCNSNKLLSPSSLHRELDRLKAGVTHIDFVGDEASFRAGYDWAIERVREMVADYL